MKKSTLIISILTLLTLTSFTQSPLGEYNRNNGEYLNFLPNNRIEFLLKRPGCLGEEKLTGEGIYKFKNDKIVIDVKTHRKELESTVMQISYNEIAGSNEFEFLIKDEENNAIPFVNIAYTNASNKLEGTSSDKNGIARLLIPDSIKSVIRISLVGYTSGLIPRKDIKSGKIEAILKKGNTIFLDNKRLKMKLMLDEQNKTFDIAIIKIR
jgi:hypothetical protein